MAMSGYSVWLFALAIVGAIALVIFLGCSRNWLCAQNAPYHTDPGSIGNCQGAGKADKGCTQAYYQEHKNYDLAFVEFSDRGNVFNDRYVNDVLTRIRQKVSDKGVVLITFIHGWKHNASEADENVTMFKETLKTLAAELQNEFGSDTPLGKRRVIGLYVGWRGKSLKFLEPITFWDRKAAAMEVGKGGVTRLLLEINQILEENEVEGKPVPNVLVVVGHSFGGAIVVTALGDVLTERAIERGRKHDHARTAMDGVIVINPAIEATQVLPMVEAARQRRDYLPQQRPLFISLSSDADSATHRAFPAGETLGLLLTWRQTKLKRSYLHDREQPAQPLLLREKHLDTTTVGNFAPFLTHRLTKIVRDGEVDFNFQTCDKNPEGCKPKGWRRLSGQPYIDLPPNYPLYFIKTDATIMRHHSDIFNPAVRAFLVTVIDDVVRGKLMPEKATGTPETSSKPSILTSPGDLTRQLQVRFKKRSGASNSKQR